MHFAAVHLSAVDVSRDMLFEVALQIAQESKALKDFLDVRALLCCTHPRLSNLRGI